MKRAAIIMLVVGLVAASAAAQFQERRGGRGRSAQRVAPNPAYDGHTFIRYFVGEPSTVRIKIFDTAGDLVKEMSAPGVGGVDNEVEWDVRDVQSGVYFARIEAQGGGQSGSTTVKIAIVK